MTVESANFINQLVTSLPSATDGISEGDNHIRMIKSVLQNTFPLLDGPVNLSTTSFNNPLLSTAMAANTIPYYTGPNSASTTSFTETGRAVVGSSSADNCIGTVLGGDTRYVMNNPPSAQSISFNINGTGRMTNAIVSNTLSSNIINNAGSITSSSLASNSISTINLNATGTVTASTMTVQGNDCMITMHDNTVGYSRRLYHNDGVMGFLNSGGGWALQSLNNGDLVASGNVGAYSDIKFKDNVETIDNALEKTLELRGVSYTEKSTGRERIGVIAQEVEKIIPEVVGEGADGKFVDYGNLVGLLIESVKELKKEIDILKNNCSCNCKGE